MTKDEFQSLVKSVPNRHNLILKLGMEENGTGRRFINKLFAQYPDTDTSHFHIVRRRTPAVEKNCPKCGTIHVKKGKFCCRKCANTRTHTEKTKKQISKSIKNSDAFKYAMKRMWVDGKHIHKNKPNLKNRRIERVVIKCINCKTDISVRPFQVKKRKFCSGSCRNVFNNKFICGNRSKAEVLLENRLKDTFPELEMLFNNRKILDGLELDVYIPNLKLAIEWNGIFHIKNIRGNLETVQKKDKMKLDRCNELGIELFVIEDPASNPKFVTKKIEEIISRLNEKFYRDKM
jgi:hypothetical protein